MRDTVRATLGELGSRDIAGSRVRVRGLVVAACPAADDETPPCLTITHEATGLALLRLFFDTNDESERNRYRAWKLYSTRLGQIMARRAYQIPVSKAGLTAARKACVALGALRDWSTFDPALETASEGLVVSVYETAWQHLAALANADDRAESRRLKREGKSPLPWVT